MRCSNCQFEVPAGEKFCPQCGAPVDAVARCAHCGAVLLPGEQFCGECGRDVTAPAQPAPPVLIRQAGPTPVLPPPVIDTPAAQAKKSSWTWLIIVLVVLGVLICAGTCIAVWAVPRLLPTPTLTIEPTWTPMPTPEATWTPAPEPTPQAEPGALLYEEDFSDPGSEWSIEEGDSVTYSLQDEAYSITVNKNNWVAWNTIDTFADFVLEMDAMLVQGNKYNAYGIFFRYVDKSNRYELDLNGNGSYTFGKKVNGTWIDLIDWTPHSAINKTGQMNHILLMVYGNQIELYVNDQFVFAFEDDDLTEGFIAPAVTSYDNPPAQAIFDNIMIWDVELR